MSRPKIATYARRLTAGLFALSFSLIILACSNDSSPVAPDLDRSATLTAIDLSDAVIIKPGQTIQKIVNSAPKGTTFLLKSGVYLQQSIRPKDGMTFVGEKGAVLDGDNKTAYAFRGDEVFNKPAVHKVTISNLEIRDYRPDTRMGAIRLAGNKRDATGWVIEKSNIHHNGDSGIRVGDATIVRKNYIHHHYMHAMSGGGDNMLIVGNELAFNGDAELAGKNGAGLKFTHARNAIIRDNYVHDNIENGIWLDLDCIDALIEGNRVIDNAGQGIMFEISYGATIRDNYVEGNGFRRPRWLYGAGIMASSSPDVEVYRNVVKNNAQGITGVMQDRGSGTLGLHELKNFYVHNNKITMRVGKTGIGVGWGGKEYFTKKGNRYAGNTYYLGKNDKYHQWDGTLTVKEWKGKGQDKDGKFYRL